MAEPEQRSIVQLSYTLAADPEMRTDLAVQASSLPIQSVASNEDIPQPRREPRDQGRKFTPHLPCMMDRSRVDTPRTLPCRPPTHAHNSRSTCVRFDSTPNVVYDAAPGVGRERVATVRVKPHDRAPQADSSGLQRFCVGQVAQNLSTHDGMHQSVVFLHERVQAFLVPCLRLAKEDDLGGLAGVVRFVVLRMHRAPPVI